jgi:uncharacterized repeat protein (TIGR02543 family)
VKKNPGKVVFHCSLLIVHCSFVLSCVLGTDIDTLYEKSREKPKTETKYSVTFHPNGAVRGTVPATIKVAAGETITIPDVVSLERDGYLFHGWNTDPTGAEENYPASISYTPTANVIMYARWTPLNTPCTVTFHVNGGNGTEPEPVTVEAGSEITLPDDVDVFSRNTYTFGGWNIDPSGTGYNYDPGENYKVTGDIFLYARWYRTVTFDANGATGTAPAAVEVNSGHNNITLPGKDDLEKTGHTFGGWDTEADGMGISYAVGTSYAPAGDITLYAKWNINLYVVNFNPHGGSGAPLPVTAEAGSDITLPGTGSLRRNEHIFHGWNAGPSGEEKNYPAGVSYKVTDNVTLYAVWNAVGTPCIITFDINGGDGTGPAPVTANAGSSVTLPGPGANNLFSKEDHIFGGWIIDPSGTKTYPDGSSYTVSGDITLYARWMTGLYTVTFNDNGASEGTAPAAQTVVAGSDIRLPDKGDLEKTSRTFGGWNTEADGTGDNFDAGFSYTVKDDIILYAKWDIIYTVSFYANGASGTAPAAEKAAAGFQITLPDEGNLKRTSSTFVGWNPNPSGGGENYRARSLYTVEKDTILFAMWDGEDNRYTVTFYANGASGTAPDPITVNSVQGITLPGGSGLSNDDYTFNGWNTQADGKGTNHNAGSQYIVSGDIELFAKWDIIYTVTFDDNEATKGTVPAAQKAVAGSAIMLPGVGTLQKTDYIYGDTFTFGGWNTDADGTGDPYDADDSYTVTGDITLYAKWLSKNNEADFDPGATVDEGNIFTVATPVQWNTAVTTISSGGNDKNYIINFIRDVDIAGVTSATFGSTTGIKVSMRSGVSSDRTLTLSGNGNMLNIAANQTVILRDITLKGRTTTNTASNNSVVYVTGTFIMQSGQITDNTVANDGGGVYVSGGTFTMNRGEIYGNTSSTNGGGVYVSDGTFTMNGGEISGNNTSNGGNNRGGGGVYVSGTNATFIMKGKISGNTAVSYGGGVFATGGAAFTMHGGGEISGNSVSSSGGGVYVDVSATFTMLGGEI